MEPIQVVILAITVGGVLAVALFLYLRDRHKPSPWSSAHIDRTTYKKLVASMKLYRSDPKAAYALEQEAVAELDAKNAARRERLETDAPRSESASQQLRELLLEEIAVHREALASLRDSTGAASAAEDIRAALAEAVKQLERLDQRWPHLAK